MKFAVVVALACLAVVSAESRTAFVNPIAMDQVVRAKHYGDPSKGCLPDELAIQIQGLTGEVCSPSCSATSPCPTDVPAGTTATPECVLSMGGGAATQCALICTPGANDGGCPKKATCEPIQGLGICLYSDGSFARFD